METPSATDDGDPAKQMLLRITVIFLAASLLFLASCKQKTSKTEKPVIDSSFIKKQQQIADSIVKASARKKKVYLTFDDGPNKGTMNVLNTAKEENIPISFFIVGKHVFDSPQQKLTWQQLKADSAVQLCNHSYTHALNHYTHFYQHPADVIKDFEESAGKLGFNNVVARMPGRNAWRIDTINHTDINASEAAIDSVHKAGFAIMGWDIEWHFDPKTLMPDPDMELLLRRMQNMLETGNTKTPGHLVLLAHDQAFQKQEAIEQLHYFFQQLKNNADYEFVLAGNYPGIK